MSSTIFSPFLAKSEKFLPAYLQTFLCAEIASIFARARLRICVAHVHTFARSLGGTLVTALCRSIASRSARTAPARSNPRAPHPRRPRSLVRQIFLPRNSSRSAVGIRYPTAGARRQTPGAQRPTPGARRPSPHSRRPTRRPSRSGAAARRYPARDTQPVAVRTFQSDFFGVRNCNTARPTRR